MDGYLVSVIVQVVFFAICQGEDLYCFDCSARFYKTKEIGIECLDSPNKTFTPRLCQPFEQSCVITHTKDSGVLVEFTRDCSSNCLDGYCKYTGLGITTSVCHYCCNTSGCNIGNTSSIIAPRLSLLLLLLLLFLSFVVLYY